MLSNEEIDAVIVHELCHFCYPNHGKDFYELVEKYLPNYSQTKKRLKENRKTNNLLKGSCTKIKFMIRCLK